MRKLYAFLIGAMLVSVALVPPARSQAQTKETVQAPDPAVDPADPPLDPAIDPPLDPAAEPALDPAADLEGTIDPNEPGRAVDPPSASGSPDPTDPLEMPDSADDAIPGVDVAAVDPAAAATLTMRPGFPRTEPNGAFFAAPVVADLFNDRDPEILTADATGCVWGFNNKGQVLAGFPWKTNGACSNTPRINAPLAVGDVNGDGLLEVVAGTRGVSTSSGKRGKVYVWNRAGKLLSGWPKETSWAWIDNGNFPEVMSVALADIAGDSRPEIIANTSNEGGSTASAPNVYAWYSNGGTVSGYPKSSPKGSGSFGEIAAADLDANGKQEVIIGRDEIYFYAYKGNGQNFSGWPIRTYVNTLKTTWDVDPYLEFTRSAPAITDFEGDGRLEIITAGKIRTPPTHAQNSGGIIVTEASGARRAGWEQAKLVGAPIQTTYSTNNQVALADLNNDGRRDIIVTYDDGTIRAYRDNGTQYWSYNYAQGKKLFASEAVVADITGDNQVEIIFGTYSVADSANAYVRLHVINTSGQAVAGFPMTLPNESTGSGQKGISAAPTVADIDGNCKLELLAHSRSGTLYVWNTQGKALARNQPWPMSRFNLQRTAQVPASKPASGTPAPPGLNRRVYLPMARVAESCA